MEVSGRRTEKPFKDTVFKSSAEDCEPFCQPCSSDGDWIVAIGHCTNCNEFLCATCLKVHRKQSISRNHKILEGENMPKEQVLSVTLNACSDMCAKHANEIIDLYCSAHSVVGCGDCMVLGHKACKVDRIQDISRSYFNGAEHQDLLQKINKFLGILEQVNQALRTSEKTLQQTYSKAEHDIKAFKKEVIDYLDKAEADMLAELKKRKQSDEELISNLKENEMSMRDKLQESHEKLQLQLNQANELFVAAKEVKERIARVGDTVKQLEHDCHIRQYEFVCSKHVNDMLAFQHKLGELLVKKKIAGEVTGDETTVEKKDITKMEPQFDCEIGIKAPDDSEDCEILACALISSSQMALADAGNNCVKIVDIENSHLSARYELKTAPNGVAVVASSCIAVTLPDEQKVLFLAVSQNGNLSKSHDIQVDGKCEKIDCKDDQLIVLFTSHVEIRNMDDGKVIKSISNLGLVGLTDIAFAHDHSKTYYVSSSPVTGESVFKYDFGGNLIASYSNNNIKDFTGLSVTRDGTVLVCQSDMNPSIYFISPECKKMREILKENKHVRDPRCLSFCDETNKLFLCNKAGFFDSKLSNFFIVSVEIVGYHWYTT